MKALACMASIAAALVIVAPAASAQGLQKLAPAQTFRFKPNAYGCLSKDTFDSAYKHAQAGQTAQMQEFFAGYNCLSTPQTSEFRVVEVVGHDVEFVNAKNQDTQGMWTVDKFIR